VERMQYSISVIERLLGCLAVHMSTLVEKGRPQLRTSETLMRKHINVVIGIDASRKIIV
jgi:hypothetical protein